MSDIIEWGYDNNSMEKTFGMQEKRIKIEPCLKIEPYPKKDIFHLPQVFMNYTMNFLKKPIIITLSYPVSLSKSKFSFCATDFDGRDIRTLNDAFLKLNAGIKFSKTIIYLNGKDAQFFDGMNENVKYENDAKWILKIKIQGYKSSDNGTASPIWRLLCATKDN